MYPVEQYDRIPARYVSHQKSGGELGLDPTTREPSRRLCGWRTDVCRARAPNSAITLFCDAAHELIAAELERRLEAG